MIKSFDFLWNERRIVIKKILSLLLAFLMATGLILSFGDEAYAEDDPFISPYEQYFEVEFDFTYDSWFQEIEFLPQRAGFYLDRKSVV